MTIFIRPFHLKILSALSINLAAGFLLTLPVITHSLVLTGNVFFAIVSIAVALRAEQTLEKL